MASITKPGQGGTSNNNRGTTWNSSVWIIVGGLGIVLGGLLIGAITPTLFPTQGSAEAVQVDNLFRFMLVIGGAIFLLVQGMLVVSVIFFRAKPGEIGDGANMHGNSLVELIWTVIPAIIVAVIAIYSYQVWVDTRSVKPNEQRIGAVGARYAWSFQYIITPDTLPTGVTVEELPENLRTEMETNGAIEFNSQKMYTWVGKPVAVSMNAEDVNHAFWVPAMRVKQDVLVGRTTEIRFTPIEAGNYRIVCAELCGAGHGNMAGEVTEEGELIGAWLIVYPDEETYRREFFEPESRSIVEPPVDPAARGRQILASGRYPCQTCHVLDDLGWAGNIGPNLNNIGERAETRVPGLSAHDYIYQSIRNPGVYLVPGYNNLMPQFNDEPSEPNYMPETDLEDIIAYLLTRRTD